MSVLPPDEIAAPFVSSVVSSFERMIGLEVIGTQVHTGFAEGEEVQGISSIIEVSGDWSGVVVMSFPEEVAREVVSRLLAPEEVEEEDITDGIGEMVNIVVGTAKAELRSVAGAELEMGVPATLRGLSFSDIGIHHATWRCVEFASEIGAFTLGVAFVYEGAEEAEAEVRDRPLRILLCDDSRVMRRIEKSSLAPLSDDVVFLEANDGQDALKTAEDLEHEIDLLVLDLKMPNMDGYEVLLELRAHPAGRGIPILIVSSVHEAQDVLARIEGIDGIAHGGAAVRFVGKPFEPSDLISTAREVLGLPVEEGELPVVAGDADDAEQASNDPSSREGEE